MKFINYLSLALTISLLTVGFAVGLPTEGHSHDGQQTSQQTQQPNSTGVKETEKGPASKARYLASVGGYETPITGGYEVPVVQPYVQQQGYGSSYQQPIQSYGTPSYGSSTYQQPIVSSYEQPIQQTYQQPIQQTYQQPIVSSYQQPIVSSYSNYSAPITSSYGGSSYQQPYQQPYQQQSYQQSYQQPYQQPIVSSYQQPIVSNYTSSYQQPIVSSYQQPIVSNYTSSYQQPYQQQSYQQSYQQPYQQQSYQQSYQQPYQQQSYQQSYQQPYQQQSYQQPYQQPIVSNYSTPVYTPPVQSYETPIVSSYQQPIVEQTYVAPVQSYGSQQSYQQPYQQQTYQQSYQQPYQQQSYQQSYQQPYQQQSYQQPYQQQSYQQSYQQPYQQQSYQQSYQQPYQQQGSYSKRQLNLSEVDGNSTSTTNNLIEAKSLSSPSSSVESSSLVDALSSTGAVIDDGMSTGESVQSVNYVSRPQTISSVVSANTSPISYVSQPIIQAPPIYNNIKSTSRYLDIQPEFTQSWADFYQPPGYLPIVFRNNYNQLPQQGPINNYQKYPTGYGGGAVNLQTIGVGYITTYGPINPAIFYVPVGAQYYYRVPMESPYYFLRQGYYTGRTQYIPQIPTNQVTTATTTYKVGYGGQFTSGFGGQGIGGFGVKRSLSSHESAGAPYSMLVDHLSASASETFTNVSSIECPPQPNPYTCPQMLNLSKEELKQKLCDYENVITGIVSFVPDTEKAQTRCGAMRIIKSDGKSAVADLPEKMAIVLGKECQLKTIMESQQVTKDQVYILTKSSIPAGTKFILADGVNVDMLSAQSIQKEEISAILKSCPAKKGQ